MDLITAYANIAANAISIIASLILLSYILTKLKNAAALDPYYGKNQLQGSCNI